MSMLKKPASDPRYAETGFTSFEEVYAAFHNPVYWKSYRRIPNDDAAHDITVDTLVSIDRCVEQYSPFAKFSTWVNQIAHNKYVDYLRTRVLKKGRQAATNPTVRISFDDVSHTCLDEKTPDDISAWELKETIEHVLRCARLSPRLREVGMRFYVYNENLEDIAAACGISRDTLTIYLCHLQEKLRKQPAMVRLLRDIW